MRLLVPLVISLLASSASAAPPRKAVRDTVKSDGSERAARATLAAELRRGRALKAKGKHTEAIAAFEAALRAVPDEPRVLIELGWELRVTGDLARAEEVCRRAARPSTEPALRAPALYNLGRVLEQKGDKPGAIVAYRESLSLRENPTVRARLTGLDGDATRDHVRPVPLEGPFASITAWCAAHKDQPCQLELEVAQDRVGKPTAPWRDARIFAVGQDQDCMLALRTDRGWFLTQLAPCRSEGLRTGVKSTIEAEDLLGSPDAELRVTIEGTDTMKDMYEGQSVCCLEQDFSMMAVCGLGPSRVPSCTPAIDLQPPLEGTPQGDDVGLEASFDGDELILRRGDGKPAEQPKPKLHPELRELVGRHRLVFP